MTNGAVERLWSPTRYSNEELRLTVEAHHATKADGPPVLWYALRYWNEQTFWLSPDGRWTRDLVNTADFATPFAAMQAAEKAVKA